jgi:L-ascorbate metabolism protein UlaG (beta-lactamase superfamily)
MTTENNNQNEQHTLKEMDDLIACVALAPSYIPTISFVKTAELKKHVDKLDKAVASVIENSEKVNTEKEKILQEAREEAQQLLLATRRKIEQQDVVQQAHAYAKQIVLEAQKKVQDLLVEGQEVQQQLILSSHKYVDHLFDNVDKHLEEKREKIAVNREELQRSLNERMNKMDKLSF